MGSIYKRGNIWWVKYSLKNGKTVRESSKSIKKNNAKRLLIRREYDVEKQLYEDPKKKEITFEDLADLFIQDYRLNVKKSVDKAEFCVMHLKKRFSGSKAEEITSNEIQKYIEYRKADGAANATVNRELSALKRMFNLAYRQTLVEKVPYIPMLKEDNARQGFFEHEEFVAVRNALPDYLKGFVTFAYRTGWRLNEIGSLKWSQVDRKNGIVRLDPAEAKNGEGRTVYLDPELKEVIERQWHERKRAKKILPYVFLNRFGNNRVKRFYKAWKKACKDAGVSIKIFHDFRRTAVRNMVRAGVPEVVAMMVSGHKTRSVFDRYNIVDEADLKRAAEQQADYLKKQSKK